MPGKEDDRTAELDSADTPALHATQCCCKYFVLVPEALC